MNNQTALQLAPAITSWPFNFIYPGALYTFPLAPLRLPSNLSCCLLCPSTAVVEISSTGDHTTRLAEMEEEANPKKLKPATMQTLSPPWIDLPDPITELILERLPLPDYVRFGAVCRKWRSIQEDRRFRHSPSQPPMPPSLPWLAPVRSGDSPLHCYSPSNRSFYRLHRTRTFGNCVFSCHGWMLYIDFYGSFRFTLINPITAVEIHPPFLSLPEEFIWDGSGAMSAPPTDPDCTILLLYENNAFLYRVNDGLYGADSDDDDDGWSDGDDDYRFDDCWLRLRLPVPTQLHEHGAIGSTTVFSGGRFYCLTESHCFYVIDPVLPKPLVQFFDMDTAQIPWQQSINFLVDFDGDVLLVMTLVDPVLLDDDFLGFGVFRPGYSEKMWVKVDQLGDRALFIHNPCSFSLSAADVGCKKNCIYHPKSLRTLEIACDFVVPEDLFKVFDLGKGRWVDEQPHQDASTEVDFSQFETEGIWLLPRLDHINHDDACNAGMVSSSQE